MEEKTAEMQDEGISYDRVLRRITVKLKEPPAVGGEAVESLVLRRPKMKHLRQLGTAKSDEERAALLMTLLSNQPGAVIDELDLEDVARISGAMERFFGLARLTGGT